MRRRAGPDGHTPAARQLAVLAVVGLAGGGAFAALATPALAPLVGWDSAALSWLLLVWWRLWPLDADRTARLVVREDPNRPVRDALLLAACVASLVAVAVVLADARSVPDGPVRDAYGALGVLSVFLSWFVVHTVFAIRYARLYYSSEEGGVDFHQRARPCFVDFAYVAFTVGATFQVSDTDVSSSEIRRTVLRHAVLSYLFGAVVIAATVNLLASLAG
ncbi:DUF1345 domain-containing protein [Micromonospora sp. PLK6-60]|uniref:DUF1345 domain-containing protein n=1 Tax=Micromonospora sp. PLK6-60 TaxID=2873383 RepID=UPI001CA79E81|nr:DUF1345 domain-containing protein [Micromonospora sp. PLK6-60]MBY8874714.1 DUF1345 domain-containing protein [Micromonospora sp. PLK6-60]